MNKLTHPDKKLSICKERVRQLETCFKINSLLNSHLELDNLLDTIMRTAKEVMKADACSLMLMDQETGHLHMQVALSTVGEQIKAHSSSNPIRVGEGIAGKVAESGRALIVKDAYKDPHFNPEFDKRTGFRTGSILCAPLHVHEQLVGVCQVIIHRDRKKSFSGKDLKLFQMFCQSAALAVQNARSHQALMEIQRLEREMDVARTVQASFLPQEIPQFQHFAFAADSVPARVVGGDFFDFIPFEDDKLAVVMGDVSGKGVSAALFMARLLSDFRHLSQSDPDPVSVMSRVNATLCSRSKGGMFTTAVYMLFDLKTRSVQIANAGHPPLILKNGRGDLEERAPAGGPPLGILPGLVYPKEEIHLKKGQLGVLITDGVIEPKNNKNNHFGMKRLCDMLVHDHASLDHMVKRIQDAVKRFSGGVPFDDMTIVAFEVL